jgi:hypothetical protein
MRFGAWPEKHADMRNAKVAVLPVPYDGTSTWGKGAARSYRSASAAWTSTMSATVASR